MSGLDKFLPALVVVAALLSSCSSATEPLHDDVDAARAAWLSANTSDYTFEIATESSWFPRSDFYRVRVVNKVALAVTDPAGQPVENFRLTIDDIWNSLLSARSAGQLNSALFNNRGVPVEVNFGEWALDGGVHYSVRNFAPQQELLVELGDTFTLRVGQQVRLRGEPLRLRFEAVTEDSRCPLDVQCVWEGNGQVRLGAQNGDDQRALELNTTVPPKAVRYGPYEISLERLEPYPATSGRIPQNQYVAKLRVVK